MKTCLRDLRLRSKIQLVSSPVPQVRHGVQQLLGWAVSETKWRPLSKRKIKKRAEMKKTGEEWEDMGGKGGGGTWESRMVVRGGALP